MMRMHDFVKLVDRRDLLTQHIHRDITRAFPVGSTVRWTLGQHIQEGMVLSACWEHVKVKNNKTGKEFWVNLLRILECWKRGEETP